MKTLEEGAFLGYVLTWVILPCHHINERKARPERKEKETPAQNISKNMKKDWSVKTKLRLT